MLSLVRVDKYTDFAFDQKTHLPTHIGSYDLRGDYEVLDVAQNLSDDVDVNGTMILQRREVGYIIE